MRMNKTRAYFQGWYFKQQNNKEALAFIQDRFFPILSRIYDAMKGEGATT